MTIIKGIECRWGILGCGPEAAQFVAELQAAHAPDGTSVYSSSINTTTTASSSTSSSPIPQIRHSIIAISSKSISASRAFADSHIHINSIPSKTTASSIETFGTSTELHAHPSIDSIFIASPQNTRYQEALSALRGGKSVLISKPLAITSNEAKELCDLASRKDKEKDKDRVKWLAFIMRISQEKRSLLLAADECAKGMINQQEQSPLLPWSASLAVLEVCVSDMERVRLQVILYLPLPPTLLQALDEARDVGAMRLPSEEDSKPEFPRLMNRNGSSSSGVADSPAERRRRISTDVSKRPASRSSVSSEHGQDDGLTSAMLRSQLHELKHVLRQKNALITSFEMKSGGGGSSRSKASGRVSLPPPGTNALFTPQANLHRRRTSSLDQSSILASSDDEGVAPSPLQLNVPLSDVLNTVESARSDSPSSAVPGIRRKRKDANGSGRRSTTPENSSLGLSTVREGHDTSHVLGEGFLAPTIASENRRIATTGTPKLGAGNGFNGLASPIISPGGGKGTSKVIESLTNELNTSRTALDSTRNQLRTSQRSISTLQRAMDETKETLNRSRTENERLGQMMSRKERQIQEALERARKAELESKELGKSSREWGARVRKIEAELGEERILKQRAEVQYETISTSWKQIREAWEKEMMELRESQGDAVKRNRLQVQSMLDRFKAAEESWRGREEEGKIMRGIIKELELERSRATMFIEGPVKDLLAELKQHEQHTSSQDAAVEAVQDELKRIKRLMRRESTLTTAP
jgi:hypothetical protein